MERKQQKTPFVSRFRSGGDAARERKRGECEGSASAEESTVNRKAQGRQAAPGKVRHADPQERTGPRQESQQEGRQEGRQAGEEKPGEEAPGKRRLPKLAAVLLAAAVMFASAGISDAVGLDVMGLLRGQDADPRQASESSRQAGEGQEAGEDQALEAEREGASPIDDASKQNGDAVSEQNGDAATGQNGDDASGEELSADGAAAGSEAGTSGDLGEAVEVEAYDINYSQSDRSFRRDGVDVLLRLRNDNEVPVCRLRFMIAIGDEILQDVRTGEEFFEGVGHVAAGETGYVYAKLYIPDDTPRSQGELTIIDVYEGGPPDGYRVPSGRVTKFHRAADAYDITVRNDNEVPVNRDSAVIIAMKKPCTALPGCWGAGRLKADLPPGEEVKVKKAIYNPGFEHFEENEYEVFVIDSARYE